MLGLFVFAYLHLNYIALGDALLLIHLDLSVLEILLEEFLHTLLLSLVLVATDLFLEDVLELTILRLAVVKGWLLAARPDALRGLMVVSP